MWRRLRRWHCFKFASSITINNVYLPWSVRLLNVREQYWIAFSMLQKSIEFRVSTALKWKMCVLILMDAEQKHSGKTDLLSAAVLPPVSCQHGISSSVEPTKWCIESSVHAKSFIYDGGIQSGLIKNHADCRPNVGWHIQEQVLCLGICTMATSLVSVKAVTWPSGSKRFKV